jgi:drug/metabolite transporter (DMT)-like permease
MFVGEFLCLVVFYIITAINRNKNQAYEVAKPGFNPWTMLIPACLDCTGTSLMYVGLTMTYPSVFQMLRGSVVIFTGIMSVVFLGRKLWAFHMAGMLLVLIGLLLVGASSVLDTSSSASASNPMLGNLFVVCAQVIVATQMVVEEKLIGNFDVPALQAVGLEGVFGTLIVSVALIIFYYLPGDTVGNNGKFEDTADAATQFSNSAVIALALIGNVISIAFFNFFGISVTKAMSATTRMVLDSVRTFVIWGFSLIVGWQPFSGWPGVLQVVGFITLLTGTCVYNKLLVIPFLMKGYNESPEAIMDPGNSSNAYQQVAGDMESVASEPDGKRKQ